MVACIGSYGNSTGSINQLFGNTTKTQNKDSNESSVTAFSLLGSNNSTENTSQTNPLIEGQIGMPAGMDLSGEVETEDFSSMIKKAINKLKNKLDENGDGMVSKEELEKALGKKPIEGTEETATSGEASETSDGTQKTQKTQESTETSANTEQADDEDLAESLSSILVQKLMSKYKDSSFFEMTPTVKTTA